MAIRNRAKADEVLTYIEDFYDTYGIPPTLREIQSAMNMGSTSVVAKWINKLAAEGSLVKTDGISRGAIPASRINPRLN